VLLCTFKSVQASLELCKVLWDSARAFSGALESICSYGSTFRVQRDLTIRIVKFMRSWYLSADLWETARTARTAVQLWGRLWKQLRPLCSSVGDFERTQDSCTALRKTWCHILTVVGVWVPQPQGISCIRFVFVISARCKLVLKQHAILPDTPGNLTSASKYF